MNRNGERALARGSRTSSTGLELEFVTQTQDMQAGDMLVSSGMGQVYPKNYPVARITSITKDPGQNFARVLAQPLAQLASTRHVMLVFTKDATVMPEFRLERIPKGGLGEAEASSAENQVSERSASPISQ